MTQFSNLSNTSWFVFDKIYATTNDFDPNNDQIMLGRYIYCEENKGNYRKEFNNNKFEYRLLVNLYLYTSELKNIWETF